MESLLFKVDKELLDLNAMEMGEALNQFLKVIYRNGFVGKGLSHDKIEGIAAKSKAIVVEMDKQTEEIKKKYYGHTEITLDHGIMYFVPILQYNIEILFRSQRKQQTLYYNPITK